ncbi:MAG: adenylate/guanylate cyclase domain-containing protein [Steroidobacterales bacterium]
MNTPAAARRLAAIVVADVVGFTRLMERDDAGSLARLREIRNEVFDPEIARYGGHVVKTAGDGMLIEFGSADAALRCVIETQRLMAVRNARAPDGDRIDYRIGVNLGDIIVDGNDIAGDGVNVAARLESMAEPGGICVSAAVREQVHGSLSARFDDLGEQRLKNLDRPVVVFRVTPDQNGGVPYRHRRLRRALHLIQRYRFTAAVSAMLIVAGLVWSGAALRRSEPPAATAPMSIAIAPLTAPANDADTSRFAESLTRDLVARLGRLNGGVGRLHVVALQNPLNAASGQLAADGGAPSQHMGTRYLLEGNVLRSRDGETVNLRLVDLTTGIQVQSVRETLRDVDLSEEPPAKLLTLGRRLRVSVIAAEIRRVAHLPITGLAPLELVMRTYSPGNGEPLAEIQDNLKLVDRALALDPTLVPAMNTRAGLLENERPLVEPSEYARIASEMDKTTSKAINIDPTDSWAWKERGAALVLLAQWDAALEAIDLAIRIDPNVSFYYTARAAIDNAMGRPADGLAQVELAKTMDPGNIIGPLSATCQSQFLLGRINDAITSCEKVVGLDEDWYTHMLLVAAYADFGDRVGATKAKASLRRLVPAFSIAWARNIAEPTHPDYARLANQFIYPGLREAGFADR